MAQLGRPSSFSQEVADQICNRLALGETLSDICREESMPDRTTIWQWTNKNKDFHHQYVRAREAGMDAWADECVSIADDSSHDTTVLRKGDREIEVEDKEWTSRVKLRVETRLRLMGKIASRKYGEKLQAEVSGAEGGPIVVQWKE